MKQPNVNVNSLHVFYSDVSSALHGSLAAARAEISQSPTDAVALPQMC